MRKWVWGKMGKRYMNNEREYRGGGGTCGLLDGMDGT